MEPQRVDWMREPRAQISSWSAGLSCHFNGTIIDLLILKALLGSMASLQRGRKRKSERKQVGHTRCRCNHLKQDSNYVLLIINTQLDIL